MANTYKLVDARDLYQPPPPGYDPIQGTVITVSALESGRRVLLVERPNKHRIRAILNNDDIHSDSIPPVGALVECIQERGLWVYVRTLNVLDGHSRVGVLGAGWGVALNRAHVYATVDNWLGLGLRRVVLQVGEDMPEMLHAAIHLDDSGVEISGAGSGVKVGDKVLFDGGLQYEDIETLHKMLVVLPTWDGIILEAALSPGRERTGTASDHSHPMAHTHHVNLYKDDHVKRPEYIDIDEILVEASRAPLPDLPAPNRDLSRITDNADTSIRVYSWQQVPMALWYTIHGQHALLTEAADIAAALGGGEPPGLVDSLLATLVASNTLTLRTAILAPYHDAERGVGRVRTEQPGSAVGGGRKITQIEAVGFRVQAQVDNPRRVTPWSESKFIYYVDYEITE